MAETNKVKMDLSHAKGIFPRKGLHPRHIVAAPLFVAGAPWI
jgi:hypothetical protein